MEINTSAEGMQASGGGPQQQQQNNDQQNNPSNQQQSQQQQNQQPPYTIPGILHYLQYEWRRFEVERQEWEVEKAEMSARLALLQGEKKAHENLKHDLIRRIKMLEYCLRMERAKYHKLKHGEEPAPVEGLTEQPPAIKLDGDDETQQQQHQRQQDQEQQQPHQQKAHSDDGFINNNSSTITYGRELLKHYLEEIGYTDTIIDLRSNRVRSLLGIVDTNQSTSDQAQPLQQNTQQSNSNLNNINSVDHPIGGNRDISSSTSSSSCSSSSSSSSSSHINENSVKNASVPTSTTNRNTNNSEMNRKSNYTSLLSNNTGTIRHQSGVVGDAESSVLATFGFLYDEAMKDSSQLEEEEEEISEDVVDLADRNASTSDTEYSYFDTCRETKAMMSNLDLLNNGKSSNTVSGAPNTVASQKESNRRLTSGDSQSNISSASEMPATTAATNAKNCQDFGTDVVDIGELANLTTMDSGPNGDDYRKKQWTNKYRLQSHYDCVRALRFSETDSLLVTASEDETIKLWHLARQPNISGKSRQPSLPPSINAINSLDGSIIDIEPLHTYRGHTSRILSITLCKHHIFSGAQNGELIMWRMISDPSTADQYDKFDSTLLVCKFTGHDDAVWSVEIIDHSNPLLCSASADMTIKVWATSGENKEALQTINLTFSPTCLAKMPRYNACQSLGNIAVASTDGKIRLYDITISDNNESNTQPKVILECDDWHRINSIVIHPTLPQLAGADSNRSIKFWDLKTQTCMSTMVAHLDEVTSLACDPTGKYLLSASHDCSARLWLFEEKACIQEITSHRKKFDEGIFAVAFHPRLAHFATAGADGLAKVFV